MRSINKSTRPTNTNSHMLDFLPAGRTPPSALWSSESAAARALMGGWCRPCGVIETALWACRSCWRKHQTCWCSVSENIFIAQTWAMQTSDSLPQLHHWATFWPTEESEELNYRSCCCRQAFMALTWIKWDDMSVDSTISMTSERSSLGTKAGG